MERRQATVLAKALDETNRAGEILDTEEEQKDLEEQIRASEQRPAGNKLAWNGTNASTTYRYRTSSGPPWRELVAGYVNESQSVSDCWVSRSGDLTGAWLDIVLKKKSTVTGIRLMGGNSPRSYSGGTRAIKDATLMFDGESTQRISLDNTKTWQYFRLQPVNAQTVRLFVETTYGEADKVALCSAQIYGNP